MFLMGKTPNAAQSHPDSCLSTKYNLEYYLDT